MKPLGQDKSAQLLHQKRNPRRTGFRTSCKSRAAARDAVCVDFSGPNGNIITWNTNILYPRDVRAAVESLYLLMVSNMRQMRQPGLDVRFAYGF
jgi:hypothetical protein